MANPRQPGPTLPGDFQGDLEVDQDRRTIGLDENVFRYAQIVVRHAAAMDAVEDATQPGKELAVGSVAFDELAQVAAGHVFANDARLAVTAQQTRNSGDGVQGCQKADFAPRQPPAQPAQGQWTKPIRVVD